MSDCCRKKMSQMELFSFLGLILTSCYLDVLLSCLEKGAMKMSPGIEWELEYRKIFFMGNNPLLPSLKREKSTEC